MSGTLHSRVVWNSLAYKDFNWLVRKVGTSYFIIFWNTEYYNSTISTILIFNLSNEYFVKHKLKRKIINCDNSNKNERHLSIYITLKQKHNYSNFIFHLICPLCWICSNIASNENKYSLFIIFPRIWVDYIVPSHRKLSDRWEGTGGAKWISPHCCIISCGRKLVYCNFR